MRPLLYHITDGEIAFIIVARDKDHAWKILERDWGIANRLWSMDEVELKDGIAFRLPGTITPFELQNLLDYADYSYDALGECRQGHSAGEIPGIIRRYKEED